MKTKLFWSVSCPCGYYSGCRYPQWYARFLVWVHQFLFGHSHWRMTIACAEAKHVKINDDARLYYKERAHSIQQPNCAASLNGETPLHN